VTSKEERVNSEELTAKSGVVIISVNARKHFGSEGKPQRIPEN
jgi:hypothetical protein